MVKEDETLQGWNAIADYLSCDVRTAKRWEEQRGLPVRRMRRTPGEGRPNVYAVVGELETWMAAARAAGDSQSVAIQQEPMEAWATEGAVAPKVERRVGWLAIAIGVVAVCLGTVTLAVWGRGHEKVKIAADEPSRGPATHDLASASAGGPRVAELYMHGSYLFEQRTPETLGQAKADFEQAIAADPNYAPAYAGLAKTYDLLREYATVPSERAYPLAKAAALRAIALDPNLADAHAALGYEEFFWEWNGAEAEREFKDAIELDPNSAIAHHWYGAMLMHQTRFAEAIGELDRAQMMEPASAGVLGTRAYAIGLSGRRDEATNMLQDILTRVPDSAPLHFILAQLCLQEPRDIPRYLDEMGRYAKLRHSDEETQLVDAGEPVYRRSGEQAMWKAMLAVEQRLHGASQPTFQTAEIKTALNMNDAALRDLTELEKEHNAQMIGLDIDALLTPLRGDSRFEQLVAKVGLPKQARD
jgi:tetratricopeptide (TPR) repeat protein